MTIDFWQLSIPPVSRFFSFLRYSSLCCDRFLAALNPSNSRFLSHERYTFNEREEEAKQFLRDLKERFAEFGLEIAEEKTQIVRFGRNSAPKDGNTGDPKTPTGTFKFLGFTHYMKQRGDGTKRKPMVARKPKIESRNKFLRNVKIWLKECMHTSVPWQKKRLSIRLKGYYRYFGLRHCIPALEHVKFHVERLWITTLRRRSQRHNLHWSTVSKQAWFRLPEPFLRRNA